MRIDGQPPVFGLIWLATVSSAMLTLMPELVGALVAKDFATTSQAGLLASLQLTGAAIGGGLVLLIGGRIPAPRLTGIAATLMAIGFAGCALAARIDHLAWMWFATGCACGLVTTAIFRLVAIHSKAARLYGIILVAQGLFGATGFMIMPSLLAVYGLSGVFTILAILALLGAPLMLRIPGMAPSSDRSENSRFLRIGLGTALVALSLLAHYLANTLLWSFAERIGAASGLDHAAISTALALSMIAGLAGAICSTLWASRFDGRSGVYVGVALIIGANLLLLAQTAALFTIAVGMMNFAVLFVVPAYLGYLADSPDGQDAATVGSLSIAVGLAGGPALGSTLITTADFQPALMGCLLLFGLALLLVFLGFQVDRKRQSLPI